MTCSRALWRSSLGMDSPPENAILLDVAGWSNLAASNVALPSATLLAWRSVEGYNMYRVRQVKVKSRAKCCNRSGRIAVGVLNNDTWWTSCRIEQLKALYASGVSVSFSIV